MASNARLGEVNDKFIFFVIINIPEKRRKGGVKRNEKKDENATEETFRGPGVIKVKCEQL